MNKYRKTEEIMLSAAQGDDDLLGKALLLVCLVFACIDWMQHDNHCEAIRLLYLSRDPKVTLNGIAQRVSKDENTLRRHRRIYISCFLFFVDFLKLHEEVAISLDTFGRTRNKK